RGSGTGEAPQPNGPGNRDKSAHSAAGGETGDSTEPRRPSDARESTRPATSSRGGEAPPARNAVEENPALPRILAAAVIIGVAAGILHASFGSVVYQSASTWWAPGLIAAALGGLLLRVRVGRGEWLVWAGVPAFSVFVALCLTNDGELNTATLVPVSGLIFIADLRDFHVFT